MVAQASKLNELPQANIDIILDGLRSMSIQELEEFKRELSIPA